MGCSHIGTATWDQPDEPVQLQLQRQNDQPLGLRLGWSRSGDRMILLIVGIFAHSCVSDWNEQHPSMNLAVGDRVVTINEIQVDPAWEIWCSIMAELRQQTINIMVIRARAEYAPPNGEHIDVLQSSILFDSMLFLGGEFELMCRQLL